MHELNNEKEPDRQQIVDLLYWELEHNQTWELFAILMSHRLDPAPISRFKACRRRCGKPDSRLTNDAGKRSSIVYEGSHHESLKRILVPGARLGNFKGQKNINAFGKGKEKGPGGIWLPSLQLSLIQMHRHAYGKGSKLKKRTKTGDDS
ncbi:hypothetical protein RUND412_001619 [Rhizina undulata]